MNMRIELMVGLALVGSCGSKHDDTCARANEKLKTCLEGLPMKENVGTCEKDPPSVELYKSCLAVNDCDGFLHCIDQHVQGTQPVVSAGARKEQCAAHVKNGLRAMAMQVPMMDDALSEATKRTTQSCVLDESKPYASCLTPEQQKQVDAYGAQRQKDCEGWTEAVAACVFDPKKSGCNPDETPLWRDPRPDVAAGPKIAWTYDGAKSNIAYPTVLAFTADHALAIVDDAGVRLVRAGKPVWSDTGPSRKAVLTSRYLAAVPNGDGQHGLAIFELATGKRTNVLKLGVESIGTDGEAFVAQLGNEELDRVTPPSTIQRLGTVPDDAMASDSILTAPGQFTFAAINKLVVTDRKMKTTFMLDDDEVAVAGDTMAAGNDDHLAVFSIAKCVAKQMPCATSTWDLKNVGLTHAIVDAAVKIDVDNDTMYYLDAKGHWEAKLYVRELTANAQKIFAIAVDDDQASLIAIERKTGKQLWATPLGVRAENMAIEMRDTFIAAQVGVKVYVVDTAGVI